MAAMAAMQRASCLGLAANGLAQLATSALHHPWRAYGAASGGGDQGFNPHGPAAFVFDIDGVLIRGKQVLPAARKAMQKLTALDGSRWLYPTCFLTNGGGVTEEHKAQQLTNWLGVAVSPQQIILSHTPMRDLVPSLGDRPVLVSGRGETLAVARSYGFTAALHTRELGRAMPAATPFSTYPPQEPNAVGTAAAGAAAAAVAAHTPCPVRDLGLGTEQRPIEAVLVFTDPDDWYRDAQLICDALTGRGVPTRSFGPSSEADAAGTPPVPLLVFSNPDLLWANEFPKNRFGQGAFGVMVEALYGCLTGGPPPRVLTFGKPNAVVYRMAERLLLQQAQELGLCPPALTASDRPAAGEAGSGPGRPPLPFSGIYAVGDNPAADVRGSNLAGPPWVSCLVRTGVFQGPGPNCSVDAAAMAVDDVAAAVDAALHRTRSVKWHSMR